MGESIISIKHLRMAMEKAKTMIANVAKAAADAIDEMDRIKMDKPVFFTADLISTDWTENAGEASAGYPYVYNLMAAGATAADGAECILDLESQQTAFECGMSSTVIVQDGKIVFYAKSAPSKNIAIQVRIIQSAPKQET